MTRLEANRLIILILEQYIEEYPDTRFSQALLNLGVVVDWGGDERAWEDDFYLESEELLKRIGQKEVK
jgi:hypothetical protein